MRNGSTLIGMGMASATYPANRSEASAIARILPDGTAMVASGTQDLGTIRVPRVVGVYDVGRVLNQKTARTQLMGGIVWGVGAALQEETSLDVRYGRFTNANLAEYHVPVNADIGSLDITFLDQPDPYINSLGVRGIGEIGITGVPAAIANAVYHATGVRVRDLPVTLDKVMGTVRV